MSDYPLDPQLQGDLDKFGAWLDEETERQKKALDSMIFPRLCVYGGVMVVLVAAVCIFSMSEKVAISVVATVCAFCVVCATKSVSRAVLLSSFQTQMNIRWLGKILLAHGRNKS